MATYFVASGGSNTSPYDTWAKAATSLATALSSATADNDIIVIQYNAVPSADAEVSVDTTYTYAGNITILSASNDGGSAYTYTAMGTANWIGNSTTNRSILLVGNDKKVRVVGMTFRTAGTTADSIRPGGSGSVGTHQIYENCYFWAGNTGTTDIIDIGYGPSGFFEFIGCTFRAGATGQSINIRAPTQFIGCSVSSSGSTPTTLFVDTAGAAHGEIWMRGCDWSLVTGTLVGNINNRCAIHMDRCKLGVGVTILAAQTSNPTGDSAELWLFDCHSGDTHTFFGYYNALGSVSSDTGIYYTSGAAAQSWKIVSNSNAANSAPFKTPWISFYNTETSAITPRLEIARDGSTTAYKDDEVWAEALIKNNSGSTLASWFSDRVATGGTSASQAAGAGTGSWTGLSGTAWSGKVDSGSSVTPAESGHVSMRVCVTASKTVYINPQILTA